MVSKELVLTNAQGFHMRPASVFATAMGKYSCDVTIKFNGNQYNAKSLLNIIAACIKCGSEIEVVCDGAAGLLSGGRGAEGHRGGGSPPSGDQPNRPPRRQPLGAAAAFRCHPRPGCRSRSAGRRAGARAGRCVGLRGRRAGCTL